MFRKPKTKITFKIPKHTTALGANMDGTITVSSKEEFDATEIRAELRCIEKRRRERWVYNQRLRRNIRQEYWDTATLHAEDIKASGPIHIVPGFKKTFPLKINIPAGGRETQDGMDSNVTWTIKAVVGVDDRPDPTGETFEVQVVRAAALLAKEEVKMVPCEYCGSLMPSIASSCPICGAPRKK
jgi:hypothetical protein